MRSVRITLGLAVVLCVFGTLAGSAFAKKTEKPPVVFGKFVASYPSGKAITPADPAMTKGRGELAALDLANGALAIHECAELRSTGEVDEESSEKLFQNVTFEHCYANVSIGSGLTEKVKVPKFAIGIEFRSNKSAEIGEGAPTELEIVRPSTVVIPIGKKSPCKVTIPSQTLPSKAEYKPEHEYEAASYETERSPASPKTFPMGYQEKLYVEMEFEKIVEI